MISDVPSFSGDDNQQTVIEHLLGDNSSSVYSRLKAHLASPYPSLAPQKTVNSIFTSLVDLLQRGPHSAASTIANSPRLLERAKIIAEAANRAEHLLEYHYASVILNSPQTYGAPGENGESSDLLTLARAAKPFPYIGNYVRLVCKECEIFSACLCDGIKSVAVVGSGPMPLTGVFMAAHLGARVTLVDNNQDASNDAKALVEFWESEGSLKSGLVHSVCIDACDARFSRHRSTTDRIEADVILVASLLPDDAKVSLLRQLAADGWDGIVGVRSAHGLTSVANYDKANREQLDAVMDFVGYAVPRSCMEEGSNVPVGEEEKPMAVFPKDVLNSLEIYVKRSDEQTKARKIKSEVERICGSAVLPISA